MKTPIDTDIIDRAVSGEDNNSSPWFGPGSPIGAMAPSAEGRQFDYAFAYNQRIKPRQEELISFAQMRLLADSLDVLRLVIETRKDQVEKLEWSFQMKDGVKEKKSELNYLNDFFVMPDKQNPWGTWIRMLLEDMFVIDAATVYPRITNGGKIYSFELIDGSTIKRVLDKGGRTPLPPDPAYQQVLHGIPAVNYTSDELIYLPRNPRTHKVYGFSPVEQIIMTINIAIRRQVHQLQAYTEGSIPEALATVPETWNADQVKRFQQFWDDDMSGDTAKRRRMKFIPGGGQYIPTKDQVLKDTYDEWLARIVCYAFSIPPTAFIAQNNRATAQSSAQQAEEEGLAPIKRWIKNLIDLLVIKYFRISGVEFMWSVEENTDPLQRAQIDSIYLLAKVFTPEEVRESLGLEKLTEEQKAELNPPAPAPAPAPIDENQPLPETPEQTASGKAALAKAGKSIKSILMNFFQTEAERVARAINDKLNKSDDDNILDSIDFSNWTIIFGDISAQIEATTKDGVKSGVEKINYSGITDQMNESAVAFANERAAELVGMKYINGDLVPNPDAKWNISETTRTLLRGVVKDAIAEGWSNDKLSEEISNSFAFSEQRADMIARTETATADVQGNMIAYKDSGIVQGKYSVLGSEHDPALDCDCPLNADAGVIGIDDAFPSGDMGPPYHVNCVCDVMPVLNMEESQ